MSVANEKKVRKPPAEGGCDKDLSDGSEGGDSAPEMRPADLNAASHRQFVLKKKKPPQSIQDRIVALKKLQLEILKLDSQFQQEICDLEKKYHKALQPLYNKRAEIINGVVDPVKEEPKYPNADLEYDEDNAEDFTEMLKGSKAIPADAKGIPNFWLTVLKNTMLLADRIKPYDEPVLKELRDVKIVYEKDSFIIEFYFGENKYFTNTKLTKKYFMRNDINELKFPFSYLGPQIFKCQGCQINWKPKKNLTKKTIIEKQKHKSSGPMRYITKQVHIDSFFDFFDPPTLNESSQEFYRDIKMLLTADFEIGDYMRSRIISRAVLIYTGELIDGEDGEDGEGGEGGENDEDDDDDREYETDEKVTDESDGDNNENDGDDNGDHEKDWDSNDESDDVENQNDDDDDWETDFWATDKSDGEDIENDNKNEHLSGMIEQHDELASQPNDDNGEPETEWDLTDKNDGENIENDNKTEHLSGMIEQHDELASQPDDDDGEPETEWDLTDKNDGEDIENDNKTEHLSGMIEQHDELASQPDDDDGEPETEWDLTDKNDGENIENDNKTEHLSGLIEQHGEPACQPDSYDDEADWVTIIIGKKAI